MLRLFFLSFLLLPLSVQAASYEYDVKKCREMMQKSPPDVKITYNFGKLKYDFSKDSNGIREMNDSQNLHLIPDGTAKVNGLTNLSPKIEIGMGMMAYPLQDGRFCMYPDVVEVKTRFEPVVYIDKDIPENSCTYKVTMRHEQAHLDISHYVFLVFVQALKVQIPQIMQKVGPYVDSSTEGVTNKKGAEYSAQIKGVFDVFVQALKQKNSILDTRENYLYEGNLCR